MQKSDLRTGMRVQLSNGEMRIVFLNASQVNDGSGDYIAGINKNWGDTSSWNDDLTHKRKPNKLSIAKVWECPNPKYIHDVDVVGELLWETNKVKIGGLYYSTQQIQNYIDDAEDGCVFIGEFVLPVEMAKALI
jgi:hypothetical protein